MSPVYLTRSCLRQITSVSRGLLFVAIVSVLALGQPTKVGAQTTWTGAVDNNFHNAGNWTLGVPNSSSDAVFDLFGAQAIQFNAQGNSDNLTLQNGIFTFEGNQLYSVSNSINVDGSLTLDQFSLSSAGSFNLGLSSASELMVENGSALTSGGGSIGAFSSAQATVTGANSSWAMNGALGVGDGPALQGGLTISNGGVVQNTEGIISQIGTGSVKVTGASSRWENSGNLTIGNTASVNGTLDVESGGYVKAQNGLFSNMSNSNAIVNVKNAGSHLELSGAIASSGYLALDVSDGGKLSSSGASLDTGSNAISSTIATVSGAGSIWQNSGDLELGRYGSSSLSISQGGKVSNVNATLAEFAGAGFGVTRSVSVSGAGSEWNNSGAMTVGKGGNATVSIGAGGKLTSDSANIAVDTGATGTILVSGANSTWNNANGMSLGSFGSGQLKIQNGGQVTSGGIYVGTSVNNGFGNFEIDGANSNLTVNGALNYYSDVALGGSSISGGGLLTTQSANLAYSGAVMVTGSGSTWTNGTLVLASESQSSFSLDIGNGGQVTGTNSQIATGQNSTGRVDVDGADSLWSQTGLISIGSGGDAAVNVSNGGSVVGGSTYIGTGFPTSFSAAAAASISGNDSNWQTGSIDIGSNLEAGYQATLSISNTATVDSSGLTKLWRTGGLVVSNGTLNTQSLDHSNEGLLQIDDGTVNIIGGSLVAASSGFALENLDNTGTANLNFSGAGVTNLTALRVGGIDSTNGHKANLSVGSTSQVNTAGMTHITDSGTLAVTGGTFKPAMGLSNNGTVRVDSGTLDNLLNSYDQTGGKTELNGGVTKTNRLNLQGGSFVIQGGRLESTILRFSDFDQVTGISGSMAGTVSNGTGLDLDATGYRSSGISNNFNAKDVSIHNQGTLFGDSRLVGSLANQTSGEVRVGVGQKMQFATNSAVHTNAGTMEAIGSTFQFSEFEFEGGLTNMSTGMIAARNATLRFDGGLLNQGSLGISFGTADVFGDIDNTGNLSIGGGAEVTFYDDVAQNGTMIVSKTGTRTSSAVMFGGYTGGGFSGGGDVFILGDLRPGFSPASIVMDGSLFLGGATDTLIELGGTELGEFDQMLISGDFDVSGSLSVAMWDGFELGLGQEFLIADVQGNLNGTFSGLSEGSLVGTYGDSNLFISYRGGDGNDIALFTAVPEPSSIGLLALFGLAVAYRRKRKLLI